MVTRVEVREPEAVEPTEHPYVVRVKGVCGGRPIIRGSRISVRHIAQLYKAGDSVEEILQAHPFLDPAAVYDALSYYLDHQQEIESEILENRIETLVARYEMEVDERGFLHFPPSKANLRSLSQALDMPVRLIRRGLAGNR